MLNICPKEFDKTEAAWSLLCLRGPEDEGHAAGCCVQSRRGRCPPPPSAKRRWKVQLTRAAERFGRVFGWGWDREADGISGDGKDTGRGELGGPRGPQGGGQSSPPESPNRLSFPEPSFPSFLSDPRCTDPPLVLTIPIYFFFSN